MKAKLLGILALAVLPLFVFAAVASAQTFRSGQTTNINSDETIDGAAWIAGSTVDVAGKIDGDLFCAGQNVTISGEVNGDIICAAQTLTFSGSATGDVRLAGQTVSISGAVGGSASVLSQTAVLEGKGNVARDASFAGQSVNVNGEIGRDAAVASATATFGSIVGRNIDAVVDTLTLTNGARVGGDVNYSSPQKVTMNPDAQVVGELNYTETKPQEKSDTGGYNLGAALLWSLMLVTSAVLVSLVIPRELHATTNHAVAAATNALLAGVVGLVACIVMPFVLVLLFVTVLGIPFAIVALITWLLILLLSGAFAAYYVGRVVWRDQTNAVLLMLVGAAIIAILLMVPILNIFVFMVAVWLGVGLILMRLREVAVMPTYDTAKLKPHKR